MFCNVLALVSPDTRGSLEVQAGSSRRRKEPPTRETSQEAACPAEIPAKISQEGDVTEILVEVILHLTPDSFNIQEIEEISIGASEGPFRDEEAVKRMMLVEDFLKDFQKELDQSAGSDVQVAKVHSVVDSGLIMPLPRPTVTLGDRDEDASDASDEEMHEENLSEMEAAAATVGDTDDEEKEVVFRKRQIATESPNDGDGSVPGEASDLLPEGTQLPGPELTSSNSGSTAYCKDQHPACRFQLRTVARQRL
jgi:hypothetical protein